MNTILTFLESHHAAATVIAAWLVREAHLWWPSIVSAFPYIKANGGVFMIVKTFFWNNPPISTMPETAQPTGK